MGKLRLELGRGPWYLCFCHVRRAPELSRHRGESGMIAMKRWILSLQEVTNGPHRQKAAFPSLVFSLLCSQFPFPACGL